MHVDVTEDLLWQRIQERLQREPERKRLNEHKVDWMRHTQKWYKGFQWDLTVKNGRRCRKCYLLLVETSKGMVNLIAVAVAKSTFLIPLHRFNRAISRGRQSMT